MKKKKNSRKATASSSPSTSVDLKTLIHDHSLFFDNLVQLIPPRFYLPVKDKEQPWFQGLSKAAKASAKKESRENLKKARRARLDPEKSSTTLDLLKKSIQSEETFTGEKEPNPLPQDNRSVTYEDLRQRLQRRIAELRANRNTRPFSQAKADERHKKNEGGNTSLGKRKRGDNKPEEAEPKMPEPTPRDDASNVDLSFGQVKLGDKEGKRQKKSKLSKVQTLEKAKRLEAAKKDPEKGEVVSKKHSWKAAVSRAAGVKVHDDPKLLKESIKKEKKRHQKSAKKWKDRVESQEKKKYDKQNKRAENIKEKITQKKMRKIAKREKKLMRPGFEGRREGYINESRALW